MYPSACAADLHSIQWDGNTPTLQYMKLAYSGRPEISTSVVKLGSDVHLIDYTFPYLSLLSQ